MPWGASRNRERAVGLSAIRFEQYRRDEQAPITQIRGAFIVVAEGRSGYCATRFIEPRRHGFLRRKHLAGTGPKSRAGEQLSWGAPAEPGAELGFFDGAMERGMRRCASRTSRIARRLKPWTA